MKTPIYRNVGIQGLKAHPSLIEAGESEVSRDEAIKGQRIRRVLNLI